MSGKLTTKEELIHVARNDFQANYKKWTYHHSDTGYQVARASFLVEDTKDYSVEYIVSIDKVTPSIEVIEKRTFCDVLFGNHVKRHKVAGHTEFTVRIIKQISYKNIMLLDTIKIAEDVFHSEYVHGIFDGLEATHTIREEEKQAKVYADALAVIKAKP